MARNSQELYGGHFTVQLIGGSELYVDASTLREVPDNQEVFVGKNDDASIIIDLLEQVHSDDLQEAMTEHLEDLLTDFSKSIIKKGDTVTRKDTIEGEVIFTHITIDKSNCTEHITKQITMFKESEPLQKIDMYVGLIRMKEYETDIIMTYNPPQRTEIEGTDSKFKEMMLSLTLIDASIFG
ncbi:hypothetical protein QEN19_001454 [Hanseniaspora menglaensis]